MPNFRTIRGSTIVELPIVLYVVFLFIFFPMLDLAAVCIRSYFFLRAVHDATINAARTNTYKNTIGADLSAHDAATLLLTSRINSASGISLKNYNMDIVQTNNTTMAAQRFSGPLSVPADTVNFTYQLELTAQANVSPLLTLPNVMGVQISGVTAPLTLVYSDRQFVEIPQGLNQ